MCVGGGGCKEQAIRTAAAAALLLTLDEEGIASHGTYSNAYMNTVSHVLGYFLFFTAEKLPKAGGKSS